MSKSTPKSISWSQTLAIKAIWGYQALRPVVKQLNLTMFGFHSECKQTPTCSEYAISSVRKHGTIAAIILSIKRISQCH